MFYIKIWAALLVLLFISLYLASHGERVLATTLIFGIATIKAVLVAAYYMGLRWESKWVTSILLIGIVFMVILYTGLVPDIVYHGR